MDTHYQKNRERILAERRLYYQENREERIAYARRRREEEPDRLRESRGRTRATKKALILEAKSSGCIRCPQAHPAALDLHHRDPKEKHPRMISRYNITGAGWLHLSLSDLRAELPKCDVLCSNCHRILHHDQGE
jgi:hypothetical protein